MLAGSVSFPVLPAGTYVGQLAAGPAGDVWFQEQATQPGYGLGLELVSNLAKVAPDGTITSVPLADPYGQPEQTAAIASGPGGSLDVLTVSFASGFGVYGVDRFAADGTVTTLPLSQPINTSPFEKNPNVAQISVPVAPAYTSLYLTVGGDGSVYVASGIAANGGVYPFKDVDRISPDGLVTPILSGGYAGGSLAVTADGTIWYGMTGVTPGAQPTIEAELVRLATDGTTTDFYFPSAHQIPSVLAGADGNVWFSEVSQDSTASPVIGRITGSGVITSYPLNNPGGSIGQLSNAPGGQIAFTQTVPVASDPAGSHAYQVGMIDESGAITDTTISASTDDFVDVDAGSIATGPNGEVWFAQNSYQSGQAQVGELLVAQVVTPPTIPVNPIPILPPALPTGPVVASMQMSKSRRKISEIVLDFSEALTPVSARRLANYKLEALTEPGRRYPLRNRTVRLTAADYDATKDAVTLHVQARLYSRMAYRLTADGSTGGGLVSASNVPLTGNASGQAGHVFTAIILATAAPASRSKS